MAAKRGRPKGPPIKKAGPKPTVLECPQEFVETIRKAEGLHHNCAEHRDPYKCAMALWRRAQGIPLRQIAAELGMTPGGIRRLEITHAKALDEQKRRFSALYAQAATEYTELLFEKADRLRDNPEQLDGISPDRLALTVGIMTDKAAQLAGMPSTVVEVRSGVSIEDAIKYIEEAKARVAEKVRQAGIAG
jgi:hypothetical protein